MRIFDGHQDIAVALARSGRDFSKDDPRHSLSLPGLLASGVEFVLATIFAAGEGTPGFDGVPASDQFDLYERLFRELAPRFFPAFSRASIETETGPGRVGAALLLEGADPLSEPGALDAFHARGVRVVALTWNNANQYAGGVASKQGLTPTGKDLLSAMSRLGIVLDVSHLNDTSFDQVLDAWDGPVVASHSNARAVANHPRNLRDDQIARLAERGAVIGLNFYRGFLVPSHRKARPATLDDLVAHSRHIAGIAGSESLALGTDFDGGFGPDGAVAGCARASDLPALAAALAEAGFSKEGVAGIMGENWRRFLLQALPSSTRNSKPQS